MSLAKRILYIVLGLFSCGNELVVANIRGTPGIDYPTYSSIPRTSFRCSDQEQPNGFYADSDTRCQVFHYCFENRQETFLCPIGTTFNQAIKSCDYWYSSKCDTTEVSHTPTEEQSVFNDQPLIPVTSQPYNVYEKMIALRDPKGNLYKQDDLSVIQSRDDEELLSENNRQYNENGDYFTDLPTHLGNLAVPQNGEQDLEFITYDHDAVDMGNTENVFSKNSQLESIHNPNFDHAEENVLYNHKDFSVPDEPDDFQLDTDETLHRMYKKEYSSEEQVNEMLNIDPNLLYEEDLSNHGVNSEAMLHKRLSEVESKKSRIRRKPKYVVLQTNFVENPEFQQSDPEHETSSSSKNPLTVTYAFDSNTIDSNENTADTLQIEDGRYRKNRKPLSKDYTYSIDSKNTVTDSENSDYQSDLTNAFEDSEASSDVIEVASGSNFGDMYEFENVNINRDEDNDNSEVYAKHLNSNNIFTLKEANDLEHQQLNLEETTEAEESPLEPDIASSDEMKELLMGNIENNYKMQELSGYGESEFSQEYAEYPGFTRPFTDSENGEPFTETFDSNEISDSYSPTNDITGSLKSLDQIVSNDEFEENESDQINLESTEAEVAATSDDITYVSADLNGVNSNFPSFENTDFELSSLNTDEQKTKSFQDTPTGADISTDSLEYFVSEGQVYFTDDDGRVYVPAGENDESGSLIYIGDIGPEGNLRANLDMDLETLLENSPHASAPMNDNSNFPTDSEDPAVVDFNSTYSTAEDDVEYVAESQDHHELAEGNSESVLGDNQTLAEDSTSQNEDRDFAGFFKSQDHHELAEVNLKSVLGDNQTLSEDATSQNKDRDFADFPNSGILTEQSSTNGLQVLEKTVDTQSNLNQINASTVRVQFPEDEHFELEGVDNSQMKEMSDSMTQDLNEQKDSKFHLSSIPLPANDYEKGLYDEQVKKAQLNSDAVNSNTFPETFYKELQAVPAIKSNKPSGTKPIGRGSPTDELLNIKTRLFRNVKSDLSSADVKSSVAEVGFPSKIIDNLFSSFSSPYLSMGGNLPGYFPSPSPKFRNIPVSSTRTGKMIKPARIFKLINFGKKLLKMKQVKLNTVRELFSS